MNKLVFWSITSSLAGFLFGFDTVVISGAEQKLQSLWNLSDGMHGLAMSSALWGTVLGSLTGGIPTEAWGRRKTLLFVGILYIISAIGTGLAPEIYTFIIARFLGGVGIGISTVAAPLYISEISPPDKRGRLAGMFQFNIVFGILIAFLSNRMLSGVENDWRWMMGVAAFPSIIYFVMCLVIPESPRWLIGKKGDRREAEKVLRMIEPFAPESSIQATADSIAAHSAHGAKKSGGFFSSRLSKPILLAFLIAFFNQLSGINAVLYFAPRIFEWTGMGEQTALLTSVGIGVTNLIATFVGLFLIDKLGRRTLMFVGSFGYIISLGLVAWAFFTKTYSIVPTCIFAFIAAHAVGQGAVIWVFISEIFPNEHRATGQALGSTTHWIFAALLTSVFPIFAGKEVDGKVIPGLVEPGYIFVFFAGMMVLQLLWVTFMMPETKGTALEDLETRLMH